MKTQQFSNQLQTWKQLGRDVIPLINLECSLKSHLPKLVNKKEIIKRTDKMINGSPLYLMVQHKNNQEERSLDSQMLKLTRCLVLKDVISTINLMQCQLSANKRKVKNGNLLDHKKQLNRERMKSSMVEVLLHMELEKRVMDL